MKTLNKVKLAKIDLLMLIAACLLGISQTILSPLALLYFLVYPGRYILSILMKNEPNDIKTAERAVLSIGLSILFLILIGLICNSFVYIGIESPLTSSLIIFVTFVVMTPLIIYSEYWQGGKLKSLLKLPDWKHIITISIASFLPVITALGAIQLNNGGSNHLTMVAYGLTAIMMVLGVTSKKLSGIRIYIIYTASLSLLLSTSLRGWGITGHDIQREFYVFQLASLNSLWDISAFKDPYNASLSITLLPTVVERISGIASEYIYKAVYQLLFALTPVVVYLIARRVTKSNIAYLSAFLFMAFPTFIADMPMLNRQEIAFLFLSLLFLITFMKIGRRKSMMLTIAMALGIILAHYSTAYLTIILISLSYAVYLILGRLILSKAERGPSRLFNPLLLSVLILGTFLWNFVLTDTTAFFSKTLERTVSSTLHGAGNKSADANYSFFNRDQKTPEEMFYQYAKDNNIENVTYVETPILPETNFGNLLSNQGVELEKLHSIIRSVINISLQLLLFTGIVFLYIKLKKGEYESHMIYVLAISVSSIAILASFILLPQLSVSYGVLRFFQQSLLITSVPIVIGIFTLVRLKGQRATVVASTVITLMFLHLSGFIPQLTGGFAAQLPLSNSGIYYDAYYVHTEEEYSARWLRDNIDDKSNRIVQADDYGQLRVFKGVADGDHEITSFLSTVDNSYQYFSYTNSQTGLYIANINSTRIYYKTSELPDNNNDLIYSNPYSYIYRK